MRGPPPFALSPTPSPRDSEGRQRDKKRVRLKTRSQACFDLVCPSLSARSPSLATPVGGRAGTHAAWWPE